jgi:prepilin-type N-terminal cleavage/methylation domain-containing protein
MLMTQFPDRPKAQSGFTLLEALIAIVIMSIGILSLAAVYAQGIQVANMTQLDYIAEKKAEQSVESIFAARDSKLLAWTAIQNVSNGGVFMDGPRVLLAPGPDGLYGTADDDATNPDVVIIGPGLDGILGTADDVVFSLGGMTRTIVITAVPNEPGLRQITVTLNYQAGRLARQYTLVSYISQFS